MKLLVERRFKGPKYTIGKLFVNGIYFCDTLEDPDRGLTNDMPENIIRLEKIYGNTAIPTGIYPVAMDIVSQKMKSKIWARPYKGKIPRLLNVKGFEGILIHPGNTNEDTLGCLLVGQNKVKGQVINSQNIFYKLMDEVLIPAYKRNEEITIEYK